MSELHSSSGAYSNIICESTPISDKNSNGLGISNKTLDSMPTSDLIVGISKSVISLSSGIP